MPLNKNGTNNNILQGLPSSTTWWNLPEAACTPPVNTCMDIGHCNLNQCGPPAPSISWPAQPPSPILHVDCGSAAFVPCSSHQLTATVLPALLSLVVVCVELWMHAYFVITIFPFPHVPYDVPCAYLAVNIYQGISQALSQKSISWTAGAFMYAGSLCKPQCQYIHHFHYSQWAHST